MATTNPRYYLPRPLLRTTHYALRTTHYALLTPHYARLTPQLAACWFQTEVPAVTRVDTPIIA